jgi:hypothetical protein
MRRTIETQKKLPQVQAQQPPASYLGQLGNAYGIKYQQGLQQQWNPYSTSSQAWGGMGQNISGAWNYLSANILGSGLSG